MDFLTSIYENEFFVFILLGIVIVLTVVFVLIAILGRKNNKNEVEDFYKDEATTDTFKETDSVPIKLEQEIKPTAEPALVNPIIENFEKLETLEESSISTTQTPTVATPKIEPLETVVFEELNVPTTEQPVTEVSVNEIDPFKDVVISKEIEDQTIEDFNFKNINVDNINNEFENIETIPNPIDELNIPTIEPVTTNTIPIVDNLEELIENDLKEVESTIENNIFEEPVVSNIEPLREINSPVSIEPIIENNVFEESSPFENIEEDNIFENTISLQTPSNLNIEELNTIQPTLKEEQPVLSPITGIIHEEKIEPIIQEEKSENIFSFEPETYDINKDK